MQKFSFECILLGDFIFGSTALNKRFTMTLLPAIYRTNGKRYDLNFVLEVTEHRFLPPQTANRFLISPLDFSKIDFEFQTFENIL